VKCIVRSCRHWDAGTGHCRYCRLCKGRCHDSGHRSHDVFGAELRLEVISGKEKVLCPAFEVMDFALSLSKQA